METEGNVSLVQILSSKSFLRMQGALKSGPYSCIFAIILGEVPFGPDLARFGVGCSPLVHGVAVQSRRYKVHDSGENLWLQLQRVGDTEFFTGCMFIT